MARPVEVIRENFQIRSKIKYEQNTTQYCSSRSQ